jgi:hypothetical protein
VLWWLKQCFIYFCGLAGMKICVLALFLLLPWLARVGDWALKWTEGNEKMQIVFVMMLFPLVMNAMQYYIIDHFIKKKEDKNDHQPLPSDDHDADGHNHAFDAELLDSDDEDERAGSEGSADSMRMSKTRASQVKGLHRQEQHEEYDPDLHGQTAGTGELGRDKVLPKALVPPE